MISKPLIVLMFIFPQAVYGLALPHLPIQHNNTPNINGNYTSAQAQSGF